MIQNKLKNTFLYIALLIAFSASAQKEGLKKLCVHLDEVLKAATPLHLEYNMTIQADLDEPETGGSMQMSFYKKGDYHFKMVIGNEQILLREGKMMLQVNNANKSIIIQEDSTLVSNDQTMITELKGLVDSAVSVEYSKEKDVLTYILKFKSTFAYTSIKLNFSAKTELLNSMHAEFNPSYPEPYQSLTVNYILWDLKWKEGVGFFDFKQFVDKKDDKYIPVLAFSTYKVFQPEKGRLNVNLK